jgi:hypothetical protein
MPGTSAGFGQVYNSGVKYIKINRFDSGGLDRTDYLNQLQSIKLTYPDRSAIEYPITTIQEQANYFIYGITPGYNTSSAGEILNYSLNVAQNYDVTASSGTTTYITNYSTVTTNPINYFTASSGVYYFHKTPNVGINYSWSAQIRMSAGGTAGYDSTLSLGLSGSTTGGKILYDFTGLVSTTYVSISGSGVLSPVNVLGEIYGPIENSYYIASLFNSNDAGSGTVTLKDFNLRFITSSAPFNGSSSLTIFDPGYINYIYDSYNPLINNAEIPQFSSMWMDVDYSQNPLVPINFGLIISGTADRAFVQDSNYSSKSWSNLRYNGSRTNSYRIIQ